jgi:RNA polymerase sigma-70 factor (ECF subfamily)
VEPDAEVGVQSKGQGLVSEAPGQPRISDESLVLAVQNGDMAAFGRLVERYQDRLYNLVLRMVGHCEDARELTQDAFLHALEAIDRFRGQASFYTWIFRIAVNAALSHRRRASRAQFMSLQELKEKTGIQADIPAPGRTAEPPAAPLQQRELTAAVTDALALLGPDARAVIVLKDVEGCDYEQIHQILRIPMGTVKSRLHRARLELKDRLEKYL